jgi:cytochrome c-type biogenesis protein CcmE
VTSKVKARLFLALIITLSVALGIALLLHSISDSIVFFYAPSELPHTPATKDMRVGGLVKTGSIVKTSPATVKFEITDLKSDLIVLYSGVIPALFRENQGIVASGKLQNGIFIAKELLTKHDENYRPPATLP